MSCQINQTRSLCSQTKDKETKPGQTTPGQGLGDHKLDDDDEEPADRDPISVLAKQDKMARKQIQQRMQEQKM